MKKMNPVVHFEMPADDKKRVAEFYANVFGWDMKQLGSDMGDYLLAGTTEVDEETMMPKRPGAINGGFYQKGKDGTVPHFVISVDDIEEHMKIVAEAGGEILGEPMEIPGIGQFVMFLDSEKNRVGMLQPVMENKGEE